MSNRLRKALMDASVHSIKNKPLLEQVMVVCESNSVIMEAYLSPYETSALIKDITKSPDNSDSWGTKIQNMLGRMGRPTREVTYDELMQKWDDEAQPHNMGEVVDILTSSGFSKRTIKRTMVKMGIDPTVGSSPAIDRMGVAIRKAKIQEPIIKFLEKSVKLTEGIIVEDIKLSDAQIKRMFKAILDVEKETRGQKVNTAYVKQWAKTFNQSVPNEQVRLSMEMIDYLKDRVGTNEHSILSDAFISIIRRSNLPEYMIRSMVSDVKDGKVYSKVSIDMKDPKRDKGWWDGTKYKKSDKVAPPKTPYNYLNNWGAEFNGGNMQDKIRLAKEIANYLADRHGTPEHSAIYDIVKAVIRKSYLPNNIVKGVFSRIEKGENYPIKESVLEGKVLDEIFAKVLRSSDLMVYGRSKRR